MKIAIGYLPTISEKGTALLSQNRQFQFFSNASFIFPVILGSAATLLKSKGHEVYWKDCIAEGLDKKELFDFIYREKIEFFVFETKTPVIKSHWLIVNELKERFPELKIAVLGDHVTSFPEETLENSKADYVLKGGDYDFLLAELVDYLNKKTKKMPKGIFYRQKGKMVDSGAFELKHNLDELPFINRELCKWRLYEKEYNLQGRPFFYIMSGRDCWWGKCTFCLEPSVGILTDRGEINIQDIVERKTGENPNILTHKGMFKPLVQTFKRHYKGKMVTLELFSLKKRLKLTPEHGIFALKRSSIKRCSKKGNWDYLCVPGRISGRVKCKECKKEYYYNYFPEFIKTKDLKKGDFVAIPIIRKIVDKRSINVKKFLEKEPVTIRTYKKKPEEIIQEILQKNKFGFSQRAISAKLKIDRETVKRYLILDKEGKLNISEKLILDSNGSVRYQSGKSDIPKRIYLTKEFLRLVGYYLAEGHVHACNNRPNSYSLCFTFSEKEKEYIEDVVSIIKSVSNKIKVSKFENKINHTVQISIFNSILALLFMRLFGYNSYNKKIPQDFIYLPLSKQKEMLRGLFRGDGHLRIRKEKGGSEYILETVSGIMAQQVATILFRNNTIPRFRVLKPSKKGTVKMYSISLNQYDIENIFPELILPKRAFKCRKGFILKNFAMIPIKEVFEEDYDGLVYNLEIKEDHSYTANNVAVSNCSWPRMYPKFRVRSVKNVLDEIGMLIEKYGAREIFDDSGTLATGEWLKELCNGLIERGYSNKIKYSCNMRFGALGQEEYNLMKKAGFRLLKFGLESANQETLDKLDKGIKVEDIKQGCKMAKQSGLIIHLTMIVGYPFESKGDALNTFELAKKLMQSGDADLLQATVLVPYPGTKLWDEAKENNWFLFPPEEYERYDMREPVLKTKDSDAKEVAAICGKIYTIFLTPQYIAQRIKSIKSWDDFRFNFRGVGAVWGHLKDFLFKKE